MISTFSIETSRHIHTSMVIKALIKKTAEVFFQDRQPKDDLDRCKMESENTNNMKKVLTFVYAILLFHQRPSKSNCLK